MAPKPTAVASMAKVRAAACFSPDRSQRDAATTRTTRRLRAARATVPAAGVLDVVEADQLCDAADLVGVVGQRFLVELFRRDLCVVESQQSTKSSSRVSKFMCTDESLGS